MIQTQYGYHIIHGPTYEQVKAQLLQASKGRSVAVAESTYLAKLEQAGKIEIKKGAVGTVRALGNDPDAYRKDNTVLATSSRQIHRRATRGWIETLPPNRACSTRSSGRPTGCSRAGSQIRQERAGPEAGGQRQGPDRYRRRWRRSAPASSTRCKHAWAQLGITPQSLADSAKTDGDREKVAAKRIDDYFTGMVQEAAHSFGANSRSRTCSGRSTSIRSTTLDSIERSRRRRRSATRLTPRARLGSRRRPYRSSPARPSYLVHATERPEVSELRVSGAGCTSQE